MVKKKWTNNQLQKTTQRSWRLPNMNSTRNRDKLGWSGRDGSSCNLKPGQTRVIRKGWISLVRVVQFVKLHVSRSVLWCTLQFPHCLFAFTSV
jgi:hypothetical protein